MDYFCFEGRRPSVPLAEMVTLEEALNLASAKLAIFFAYAKVMAPCILHPPPPTPTHVMSVVYLKT